MATSSSPARPQATFISANCVDETMSCSQNDTVPSLTVLSSMTPNDSAEI